MTEQEAIKELKYNQSQLYKSIPCDTSWGMAINESFKMAISALEEIQQYRAIGTIEEIKRMQKYSALAKKHDTIGKVIESCAEYEEIGTVEECREAREKQKPKSPDVWGDGYSDGEMVYDMYDCPGCGESYEIDGGKYDFCPNCGQALDWRT